MSNYNFQGSGQVLLNTGNIAGTANGVLLAGSTSAEIFINSGEVHGGTHSVYDTTGAAQLRNTGMLDGDVSLGNGSDKVMNFGAIIGDVTLGNGDNYFNGRGGTVTGAITGGTGIDTIFAGNDGEVIAGGKGHDVLFGGSGADSFDFSSYSAADRDTVHGFSAANDHIQLDHTVFTHLQAGAAPMFAVAAASTGATDFLFYNSATGGLYYDPDASGSHAAGLFAMLDPGLHLTAANFEIV